MPTTYTPLATQTVSGSSTTSVTFTGISGAYTDLVVVANVASSDASQTFVCRLNGDSGSNYSLTQLLGEGTGAVSQRESNQTRINISRGIGVGTTLGNMVVISNFQNYSNTTTNKTVLSRVSEATASFPGVSATVGLWRNTAAITSIEFFMANGTATFVAGSTFSLYGVASTTASIAKATGGTITYNGSYVYHTFTSSGTFTPTSDLTADILVISGGGGSGGGGYGSGGGAGGHLLYAGQSLSTISYTVTVGGGGTGASSTGGAVGANGTNSQFGALTAAIGGGGGGASGVVNQTAGSGGSGGGSGANNGGNNNIAGSGTAGQGFGGGTGQGSIIAGAGGGGAGAVGSNPVATHTGGAGGIGTAIYSAWALATGTGEAGYFAGGGGGSGYEANNRGGAGGLGGGGRGGISGPYTPVASNGTANTGGGGGGGVISAPTTGSGGSGLVIVRYAV